MPIVYTGPLCARRGCNRPEYSDGLCALCRRLARMFGKHPAMFAYEPLDGYRDDRDAVELPWEAWEQAGRARGAGVADLFVSGASRDERSAPATRPPDGEDASS